MKKENLLKAAKELNEKLGLDPAIDVKAKGPALSALIAEAAGMIEEGDDISKETLAVIKTLKEVPAEQATSEEKTSEETAEAGEAEETAEAEETVEEEIPAPKTKIKTEKKSAKKAPAEKTPGVISTIICLIEKAGKKGISKDEIAARLEKAFPERNAESMKKTLNVQVPHRISKERFQLVEKDGKYSKAPE
jgi:hypothetical protein